MLNAGVYSHTVPASTGNTAMNTKTNELVMTHKVDTGGCKKEDVNGVKVCTKTGHLITFTCSYPMKNQDIKTQTDFKVSGSDTEKTAAGTGKLTYKLTVDKSSFSIGSKVTATITPVTIGLVHATIESCKVTHKSKNESVKLIDDGMQRECKLGVDVTTAQGTGVLGFNWSSFKWSTALSGKSSPDEDQDVSCNISLSKAKPTTETQNVCAASSGPVTWTNMGANLWCPNNYSPVGGGYGLTLDECKAKCVEDSNCVAIRHGANWGNQCKLSTDCAAPTQSSEDQIVYQKN